MVLVSVATLKGKFGQKVKFRIYIYMQRYVSQVKYYLLRYLFLKYFKENDSPWLAGWLSKSPKYSGPYLCNEYFDLKFNF